MVNVGMLAVILNVCTLLIAVLAERAIERIMTTFAISRLKSTRRAPVVHDSDAWLFNFPRSLIKYYKYPGMFILLPLPTPPKNKQTRALTFFLQQFSLLLFVGFY